MITTDPPDSSPPRTEVPRPRKWRELLGRYIFGFKEGLREMNAEEAKAVSRSYGISGGINESKKRRRGYGFLRNPLFCLAVPVPPKGGTPVSALCLGVGREGTPLYKRQAVIRGGPSGVRTRVFAVRGRRYISPVSP